jgi:hypothetical protein
MIDQEIQQKNKESFFIRNKKRIGLGVGVATLLTFLGTGGGGYVHRQIYGDYRHAERIDTSNYDSMMDGINFRIEESEKTNWVDLLTNEVLFTAEATQTNTRVFDNNESLEDMLAAANLIRAKTIRFGFVDPDIDLNKCSFEAYVTDPEKKKKVDTVLQALASSGIEAYVTTSHELTNPDRSVFPDGKIMYELLAIDRFLTRVDQEPTFRNIKHFTMQSDERVQEYVDKIQEFRKKSMAEHLQESTEFNLIYAIGKYNQTVPDGTGIKGLVSDNRMYHDKSNSFSREINSVFLDVHKLLKEECAMQGIIYVPVFDISWNRSIQYNGNRKVFWQHLIDSTDKTVLSDLGYSSSQSVDPYDESYNRVLAAVSYVRKMKYIGDKKELVISQNVEDMTELVPADREYRVSWNSRLFLDKGSDENTVTVEELLPENYPMRDYDDLYAGAEKLLRALAEPNERSTIHHKGTFSIGIKGDILSLQNPFITRSDIGQEYIEDIQEIK